MECIICVEPFTKQKRKQITCEYCEFTSCKQCFETYLLNESKPRCMNNACGREWTPKFLSENFPHTFINGEYKTHYIKYGRGDLFDPFGADRNMHNRPYFDFKKVKENVYNYYIEYLTNRDRIFLTRARRSLMEV